MIRCGRPGCEKHSLTAKEKNILSIILAVVFVISSTTVNGWPDVFYAALLFGMVWALFAQIIDYITDKFLLRLLRIDRRKGQP